MFIIYASSFSGEAGSELSFTQSSSSGFVTGREDGNTSSLLSADTEMPSYAFRNEDASELHVDEPVAPTLRYLLRE